MKKIVNAMIVSGTLLAASAHAAMIEDTWTVTLSSVDNPLGLITASAGDSFSFTVTYDDSLHSMLYYDSNGVMTARYCDRIAVQNNMYNDCNYTGYTGYGLFADNQSSTIQSAINALTSGIDVFEIGEVELNWSYLWDNNDSDVSNDYRYHDYRHHSGTSINAYDYANPSSNDYFGASLRGMVNGQNTYIGNLGGSAEITGSRLAQAKDISEPGSLAAFVLGLVGLAGLKRRKAR